jgi:hypothetical protein
MFLKIVVSSNLEPSKDLNMSPLDLAIAPRVRHGGKIELDTNIFAVLLEVLACELSPVVSDNPVRDPELTHN